MWIVYELGQLTLSSSLYEIQGEFFNNERIYRIHLSPLYKELFQFRENNYLKSFIKSSLNAIRLLNQEQIIHGDIKPDNLLLTVDQVAKEISSVKLIDFGSSFFVTDKGSLQITTLEYQPPEIIELFQQGSAYNSVSNLSSKSHIEHLMLQTHPWSIDIWSLGMIIIELLLSCPHWMVYKCRITDSQGKSIFRKGLFSSKNADYERVTAIQRKLCENMRKNYPDIFHFIDPPYQPALEELLQGMLQYRAEDRKSPAELMNLQFFR